MATPHTPSEMRNKISQHLEKGAGIYASHPTALGGEPAEFGKNRTLRFSGQP